MLTIPLFLSVFCIAIAGCMVAGFDVHVVGVIAFVVVVNVVFYFWFCCIVVVVVVVVLLLLCC